MYKKILIILIGLFVLFSCRKEDKNFDKSMNVININKSLLSESPVSSYFYDLNDGSASYCYFDENELVDFLNIIKGKKVNIEDVDFESLGDEAYGFDFGPSNNNIKILVINKYVVNSDGSIYEINEKDFVDKLPVCDYGSNVRADFEDRILNIRYLCIKDGNWYVNKLMKKSDVDKWDIDVNVNTDDITVNNNTSEINYILNNTNEETINIVNSSFEVCIDENWYKVPNLSTAKEVMPSYFYDSSFSEPLNLPLNDLCFSINSNEEVTLNLSYVEGYDELPLGKYRIVHYKDDSKVILQNIQIE